MRSSKIVNARRFFQDGKISKAELTQIEDEEISVLVKQEIANGLKAVTDGEFRRAYWHLDFLAALNGIEHIKAKAWSVAFADRQPKAETIKISGKIAFSNDHPFLEAFSKLKSIAGEHEVKFTIPSPSMLHLICCVREANYEPIALYRNNDESLFDDIADAWCDAVKALYDRGCRYLQLDDTSWGELCSLEKREAYAQRGIDLDKLAENYVAVINRIMEAKPADMVICMHICRGNFRSTWFSSGGYEPVAPILFAKCNVDGFFLEYDTDRAGDSQYVPLDRLCLSTQCGFSSTEEGNILSHEAQWAKIRLVCEIAKEVWSDA